MSPVCEIYFFPPFQVEEDIGHRVVPTDHKIITSYILHDINLCKLCFSDVLVQQKSQINYIIEFRPREVACSVSPQRRGIFFPCLGTPVLPPPVPPPVRRGEWL